jgi:hypothetical protein
VPSFFRAYRVTVGTVQIDALGGVGTTGMRIAFNVERDHKRAPNNAELAIWNLSEGSREALARLDVVPVQIEAGYADDVGVVFLGDLRSARSRRDGPDIITRVSAGDGESKIRTARVNRTFARGTPVGDVIGQLGKALGVSPGNLSQFQGARLANGSSTLTRALTISGAVSDELERLCRSCGLDWSVQNGVLQLRDTSVGPVGSETGPLLRVDTGLLGEVETERASETKDGLVKGQTIVSGRCLMRADLVPGKSARIESEAFTGNVVVRATTHAGDSHSSDPWHVEFTAVPY